MLRLCCLPHRVKVVLAEILYLRWRIAHNAYTDMHAHTNKTQSIFMQFAFIRQQRHKTIYHWSMDTIRQCIQFIRHTKVLFLKRSPIKLTNRMVMFKLMLVSHYHIQPPLVTKQWVCDMQCTTISLQWPIFFSMGTTPVARYRWEKPVLVAALDEKVQISSYSKQQNCL